jgi:hypothetical protein
MSLLSQTELAFCGRASMFWKPDVPSPAFPEPDRKERRMFRKIAPRQSAVALVAFATALIAFAGTGYAGHGPLPNHDPACTASQNPVAVGGVFTLSATALPTTDPVWLIVQPPSGSGTVSLVYVAPDGTWSGAELAGQSGTWTYSFSGLMNNKKYGTVETCSVQAN